MHAIGSIIYSVESRLSTTCLEAVDPLEVPHEHSRSKGNDLEGLCAIPQGSKNPTGTPHLLMVTRSSFDVFSSGSSETLMKP